MCAEVFPEALEGRLDNIENPAPVVEPHPNPPLAPEVRNQRLLPDSSLRRGPNTGPALGPGPGPSSVPVASSPESTPSFTRGPR